MLNNILIVEIPFDEVTPEEIAQYESDPDVEIEVDGDEKIVFVLKKQF